MDIENTKGGDKIRNILWDFDDFIRYQLEIAERWLEKGNKTKDIFSKFFYVCTCNAYNLSDFMFIRIINFSDKKNYGQPCPQSHFDHFGRVILIFKCDQK